MNTLPGVARALVEHIDLIKRQIRSDVTPTIGQVEELFDLSERLDTELRFSEPIEPCSIPSCQRPAVMRVHDRPYCSRCGRALGAVTKQVQTDAPAIARAKLEAMVAGNAPWPASTPEGVLA